MSDQQVGEVDEDPFGVADPAMEAIQRLEAHVSAQDLVSGIHAAVDRTPALGDPSVGPGVVQHAQEIAQALGAPQLGQNPQFWEMTYHAVNGTAAAAGPEPVTAETFFGDTGGGRRVLPFG